MFSGEYVCVEYNADTRQYCVIHCATRQVILRGSLETANDVARILETEYTLVARDTAPWVSKG